MARTSAAARRFNIISGGLDEAKDMVFGPNGDLFISSNASDCDGFGGGEGGRVMAFNGRTGNYLGDAVPTGSGASSKAPGLSEAMALAYRNGILYVGNDFRCKQVDSEFAGNYYSVMKFQLIKKTNGPGYRSVFKGNAVVSSDDLYLQDPNGMAFGPDGNLYIAWEDDRYYTCGYSGYDSAGAIMRYNPRTNNVVELITGAEGCAMGFTEGSGIAFGPKNKFYVGSGDTGEVFMFNINGNYMGQFPSLYDPKGIAFQP